MFKYEKENELNNGSSIYFILFSKFWFWKNIISRGIILYQNNLGTP